MHYIQCHGYQEVKQVSRRFLFVLDEVANGIIKIEHHYTDDTMADGLTQPLHIACFLAQNAEGNGQQTSLGRKWRTPLTGLPKSLGLSTNGIYSQRRLEFQRGKSNNQVYKPLVWYIYIYPSLGHVAPF